ncbi:MAG: CDP-diacylglycerol--serine O-phosphatidyltransferase, partial [Bacteroidaceae bacterium]|nr:CDP-diacylglycerol--serine O-phosphatidyltransferase [Bacteroidaceae bacterium]
LGVLAEILPYMAFLIAVFSACRLAKFNVDKRQTNTFIGLPTPANVLFWSSLITGAGHWIFNLNAGWLLLSGLIILFSYFLVSEIPMFSLKFKNLSWESNKIRYIFIIVSAPMLALGYLAPVFIITWYLLLSIILYIRTPKA